MRNLQESNMLKVLLCVTIFIGCQATELLSSVRNGDNDFVQFYVFTQDYNPVPHPININDAITSTPINYADRRTVIIIHGHRGSWLTTLNPLVKDELLESEDLNVVVIDWALSASNSYSEAVRSVPNVASQLSTFIDKLVNADCATGVKCASYEELHLIGFDLGAHVVGQAARAFNGQIGRITGLDPSGTNWGTNTARLTKSDALYVEVIHTDGSGLLNHGIGTALGDVDFFVNGGSKQPGCLSHQCCHNRAYEFYAASLRDNLSGRQCKTNLQLTMNLCERKSELAFGNNELDKLKGDTTRSGVYRINTSWGYP